MIIKKTILNHNFVPMYINTIENQILSSDKQTVNNLWDIEYYDKPLFIKPFQTKEVLLSINTNVSEWDGVVYLDSTYYSDLYDTFGTITGWHIKFKRDFTIYNYHLEPVMVPYRPSAPVALDVEMSLFQSGKMFQQVLDSFRAAGFAPEIKSVEVYRPYLYGCFACCDSQPEAYKSIRWNEATGSGDLILPGKILHDGDDYIYQLQMDDTEVTEFHAAIRNLLDQATGKMCGAATVVEQLRMLFTPYGFSVKLNLTPNADNPYIVEYNLFNSLVWIPFAEQETPLIGDRIADPAPFLYDHTGNTMISQERLVIIPHEQLIVNTHSDEAYSFEVLILLPFGVPGPVQITDAQISPSDASISLNHSSLPHTLLGSVNGLRDEFATFSILINVDSGLITDYVGDLTIAYDFNGDSREEIINVQILPDLEKYSSTFITALQYDNLVPTVQVNESDDEIDLILNYEAYLGLTSTLYLTLSNDGNQDDEFENIIYDKQKFKLVRKNSGGNIIPAHGNLELQFQVNFLQQCTINDIPFSVKTKNTSGIIEYQIDAQNYGLSGLNYDNLYTKFLIKKPKIFASNLETTKYIQKGSYTSIPFNVSPVGCAVTRAEVTGVNDEEIFLDTKYFPILEGTHGLLLDTNIHEEGLHDINIRLYTNNSYLQYIDVPVSLFVSDFNLQEDFVFDANDFYVDENNYFLSLVKLQPKTRYINFRFLGNYPLKIEDIQIHQQRDRFGADNLSVNILNKPDLPTVITQNQEVLLEVEISALEFGYTLLFFIFKTTFGDIYMPVSVFCNTKYKDVYITNQSDSIIEYTSIMGGYNRQFIRLTNYGDQICEFDTRKLGYDQSEFLIKDNGYLQGNSINYIDTVFLPAVTGKRSAYLDVKLEDMLNTFILNTDFTSQTVKIQASHIIYKLFGIAITEEAFPKFNHEIVDLGFINISEVDQNAQVRYSTIEITNLGLNPYVILGISSPNPKSPFKLLKPRLPSAPSHRTSVPVVIDYDKINGAGVYFDVFTFTIQDLKTKKEMVFNIPIKVQLTETAEIYVAVNSELINFGLAEIAHQKTDELVIRNYSTDRIVVTIDYTGDYEFTTFHPMNIGLSPSQSFTLPIHFFPHGINTFTGKITISVDTFVQEVNLVGQGVDFLSPLIRTTNKLYDFFKELGYR